MFKKNLDTIRIKNSKLADRLEKIDINSITGIEVFESESKDLIISYKNTTLHSPIDPVRESKTTWNRTIKNNLKKNDIQIVFGLGLGYLFKRAYVNSESKVLRFVLEHVDFSNELSDERVYITDNVGDIYDKLQKEYLSNDRVEFLFLNQYALANQELLQDLTSKTFEIVENRGNDENTILKFSWLWTENFIRNFVHFPEARPLGFFEGKFADKTALIIAAGSSLADDIEKIKKNQDKFVTIAVGRAFNSLVNNGVIPDFTVFADARNCLDQIKGLENFIEKTNLILLAKTDQNLYKLKSKTKIMYFSETDSITRIFKDVCPENAGFYKSGSSVSILSYYIAKALGFGQIAFSGLDLAFIDNKIFADGQTIENVAEEIKHKIIHVKDKEGNDLITRTDYAWFIRQFNEIFSEELNLATVINTSLKGAFINGMEYMAFSEFAETLSTAKPDIDNIISSVFTETKESWDSALINVFSLINLAYKDMEQIRPDLSELFNEFAKICTELSELGKTDYDPEAYMLLNNKAVETRKRVVNNLFLSNYIQSQTWNYTKNYVTKTLPNKEDVINNLELDKYFFNAADCANRTLIRILKETLNTLEETQGLAIK